MALRKKKSDLLNFKTHSDFVLEMNMAKNSKNVTVFLGNKCLWNLGTFVARMQVWHYCWVLWRKPLHLVGGGTRSDFILNGTDTAQSTANNSAVSCSGFVAMAKRKLFILLKCKELLPFGRKYCIKFWVLEWSCLKSGLLFCKRRVETVKRLSKR